MNEILKKLKVSGGGDEMAGGSRARGTIGRFDHVAHVPRANLFVAQKAQIVIDLRF